MAGSLIKIDEEIVSGAVASVTLVGIDSTYDVYMVQVSNAKVNTDDALAIRVTKSGSADTTANYDDAKKYLKSGSAFSNISNTNATQIDFTATIDSGVSASNANGVAYLFNFGNASEYSFATIESTHFQYNDNEGRGFAGGFVHTVASASDGVLFKTNGGNNITLGNFTVKVCPFPLLWYIFLV